MLKNLFFFVLFIIGGCQSPAVKNPKVKVANGAVEKMEKAHHKTAFLKKGAIQFDLKLIFGGQEAFNGNMMLWTDSSRGIRKNRRHSYCASMEFLELG